MSKAGRHSDTDNAIAENAEARKPADQARTNAVFGPEETFDPYMLIDPFDKEAVRRQKRLRRAALRGKIPLRSYEEEGASRSSSTSSSAPSVGNAAHKTAASRTSVKTEPAPIRKRRRAKRILASLAAVLLLVAVCAGGFALYEYLRPPDFSSYADTGISISGIEEADFIVTPQELSELECVEVTATGQGRGAQGESRVGTVTAYGPTLNTFLAEYGLSQTDFSRIIFECKDGYTVVLARDALESEVILTLSVDKDELAASHQPLRLVIPDESSGQWAYGILRIEFEQ